MFASVVSVGGWAIGRLNEDPTPALRNALRREVQLYKHVPVYVVAGTSDKPMVKGSRLLHEVLTKEGGECIYKEIMTNHVGSAGKTWTNRKIIEWLFNQNKQKPVKGEQ
jgi:predicted esterase